MSLAEAQAEVSRQVKALARGSPGPWLFTTDFTAELLALARRFRNEKRTELAILFFATWLEHEINSFVFIACIRRGYPQALAARIIREVGYPGKYTWLFTLLGLPALNATYQGHIREMLDARNAFVHYKWRHFDGDRDEHAEHVRANAQVLERAEPLVRYLTRKHSKFAFPKGRRNLLPKRLPARTAV